MRIEYKYIQNQAIQSKTKSAEQGKRH